MNFLDYRGLFILTLLYYYQGLVIGFLFSGISILLAEKGVPYQKIGYLASAGLPFTLKFLWAPILDFYFIESLGKRKTYIIPCLFFVGLIYLYLAQSFK